MSERLPVVSGAQLIDVLQKFGWEVARQRGSHVRLKHQYAARVKPSGGSRRSLQSVMSEARGWLEVSVQHKRVEVGAVGPYDGSQLVVHAYLVEEVGIGKRLEHGPVQLVGEIDIARAAIAKAKPQSVVAKDLYGCHPYALHSLILRQWIDRLGGVAALRTLPVCFQFLTMQTGPLAHELERATWSAAVGACVASSAPSSASTGSQLASTFGFTKVSPRPHDHGVCPTYGPLHYGPLR